MLLGGDNFIIKVRHATKHYLLREHLPIVVMVVVKSGVTVVGLAVLVGRAAVVVPSVGFTCVLLSQVVRNIKYFIMTVQLQRYF